MADLAKMISDIADIESSIRHLITEFKQRLQFVLKNEMKREKLYIEFIKNVHSF